MHCLLTKLFFLCISNLSYIDQCTELVDTQRQSTVCTPIRGRMSAEYVGDADFIKQFLLKHIEEEMNSGRVRIENVSMVRFIGDRNDINSYKPTRAREGLDPTNNSNNAINIALMIGILVAVVAILAIPILLLKGRRRRQTASESTPALPQSITLDPEKQQHHESVVQHVQSGDTEESIPEKASFDNSHQEEDDHETSHSNTESGTESAQKPNCKDQSTDEAPPTTIDTSNKTKEVKSTEKESTATTTTKNESNSSNAASARPPIPPISVIPVDESKKSKETNKSKTLQKRRKRKKKKKKKPVLKRISSRNSIDEMETITEEAEQETDGLKNDDDDEEEFSEYSTDDEDDDQWVNLTDASAAPGSSDAGTTPPSPIHEEPKIRPIPPPWV